MDATEYQKELSELYKMAKASDQLQLAVEMLERMDREPLVVDKSLGGEVFVGKKQFMQEKP